MGEDEGGAGQVCGDGGGGAGDVVGVANGAGQVPGGLAGGTGGENGLDAGRGMCGAASGGGVSEGGPGRSEGASGGQAAGGGSDVLMAQTEDDGVESLLQGLEASGEGGGLDVGTRNWLRGREVDWRLEELPVAAGGTGGRDDVVRRVQAGRR